MVNRPMQGLKHTSRNYHPCFFGPIPTEIESCLFDANYRNHIGVVGIGASVVDTVKLNL